MVTPVMQSGLCSYDSQGSEESYLEKGMSGCCVPWLRGAVVCDLQQVWGPLSAWWGRPSSDGASRSVMGRKRAHDILTG